MALLLSATLTACGGSASSKKAGPTPHPSPTVSATPTTPAFARESGGSIVAATVNAMTYIGQVRYSGSVVNEGKRLEIRVINDIRGHCSGTMRQGSEIARFISTTEATYLKGNLGFWKDAAGKDAARVIALLAGRWARAEASDAFDRLCSTRSIISFGYYKTGTELVGKGATVSAVRQYHGHSAVEVTGRFNHGTVRYLVEVEAPHRLFHLSGNIGGLPTELAFDYDDDTLFVVPGAGESVGVGRPLV
jgi:hypothetical protein